MKSDEFWQWIPIGNEVAIYEPCNCLYETQIQVQNLNNTQDFGGDIFKHGKSIFLKNKTEDTNSDSMVFSFQRQQNEKACLELAL